MLQAFTSHSASEEEEGRTQREGREGERERDWIHEEGEAERRSEGMGAMSSVSVCVSPRQR